ncbi:MAG: hypothetical protein A3F72_21715 [Bacteroidetes bacterium RIFCSPLOWO2_12_FULL_35_15]|nr:MAG: hypothetical protein A3F72_21715 [Bacteroidetes bacterium RIFCSPLOWO2_12_FULL_35_15]
MSEEFLHYIWKFRLFDQLVLQTTAGEPVEIVKVGEHNFDSGPDFFNAKIKVGKTLWAGNVEVHINSSDWKKHFHQKDKAYDNIVLHVVHKADEQVFRESGEAFPTIEIKNRIDNKIYQNYLNFKSSSDWIPCEKQINKVPDLIINNTLDRLLLERLERKSTSITESLKLNKNNWEETFYQHFARNFGFKINAEPFELLAKSLPSIVLSKHKNSLLQIEGLLFGQAGLLDQHYEDKYMQQLQNEYVFLKQKFKLQSIDSHLWKYLRLRPVNFPTIRIAQFANLIFNSSYLFSKIIETENYEKLKKMMNVDVSEYWRTHYVIDKISTLKTKQLGDEAMNNIIINTIVPFLFVYGKHKGEEKYIERALQFLEQIKGERNSIIKKWEGLNLPVKNSYSTQALLQLKNEYCSKKKCLSCSIGNYLLKNL